MCTPGWVKEAKVPDSDVVLFPQKHPCLTTAYAAHVPSRLLCLDDVKRETTSSFQQKKNHSIAVGPWARPFVLSHALSQASHSPFSVYIHTCCRTVTKTSSSTVEVTSTATTCSRVRRLCSSGAPPPPPTRTTPGQREPTQSQGQPAGGSSRSSQSQPHSPSMRQVEHGRSFGPLRQLSGSRRHHRA